MSPVEKPSSRPPIGALEDEQSEVRARVTRSTTILPPALDAEAPSRADSSRPAYGRDPSQVAELLIQAKALLATLPLKSRRAQLLRLAVMRRDQILLEALITNVELA